MFVPTLSVFFRLPQPMTVHWCCLGSGWKLCGRHANPMNIVGVTSRGNLHNKYICLNAFKASLKIIDFTLTLPHRCRPFACRTPCARRLPSRGTRAPCYRSPPDCVRPGEQTTFCAHNALP